MESLDIDQESAKRFLEEGGFFLLLEMPIGSSIGIDLSEYNVGHKFKGFKMIPPGLHFIHYSAVNQKDINQSAPRTGFFHFFQHREVLIKQWDTETEDISSEELDLETQQRYKDNLIGSLDAHLAPYPLNDYAKWVSLTDQISPIVLTTLNPICGKIKSVAEMVPLRYPEDVQDQQACNKQLTVDNLLPQMKLEPNSRIQFSEIDKIPKLSENATPSDITKHILDSTYSLEKVMQRYPKPEDVLGELQFAFVTFIVGQVYESFEHWKALLKLLCNSDSALIKYHDLYKSFIHIIHSQLKEVPPDLFVDIVDNENFLVAVLRDFFYNINSNQTIDQTLKKQAEKLKDHVTKKYEWDFDTEPDDECPVIVELD